jgi:predicted DNA-binding transcriptional regulator YafY
MRRADRLFEIVQLLQSRRFMTAQQIAGALEVSVRTVYRDTADLMTAGVPIDGEAGVGYRLDREFDLPPLMFDRDEIEALLIGARIVQSWANEDLAHAASRALIKIESVLPDDLRPHLAEGALFALRVESTRALSENLAPLRAAIQARHKINFEYTRLNGEPSERTVHPLGLFYWGTIWSLAAWCELRNDFRTFRIDRIEHLTQTDHLIEDTPGRTLDDYMKVAGERS